MACSATCCRTSSARSVAPTSNSARAPYAAQAATRSTSRGRVTSICFRAAPRRGRPTHRPWWRTGRPSYPRDTSARSPARWQSTLQPLRAARAHSRIGSVVCDLWRDLPIRSETACAVLNVFAPRNPAEYRRVLRSDGGLFLVTPAPGHLRELIRPLGLLSVSDEKIQQVDDLLGRHFELISRQDHEIALLLPATAVQTLACMGPSAWHLTAAHVRERLAGMADPLPVTASFTLSV